MGCEYGQAWPGLAAAVLGICGCAAAGGTYAAVARGPLCRHELLITPFVDVVLVLLVMFMVTAPILQSGIEVDVPKTKTVKEITQERLVITIDKDQRVFLGNDPVNINEIPDLLRAKDSRSAKPEHLHPRR